MANNYYDACPGGDYPLLFQTDIVILGRRDAVKRFTPSMSLMRVGVALLLKELFKIATDAQWPVLPIFT